ncbi:MAG: hypothetical protein M1820_008608 [Bogoriella megaspora]|nr:MAG: hypothetical protein M1820_008608 [Bogoriella megaspora]
MALSLSNFLFAGVLLLPFGLISQAATVTYDWNITWVTANPDGAFDRPTIGINGQWPLPLVNVTKGDRLVVNVNNQLGNQSTSLHFHGIFQNGTTHMDGPVGATQCAVPPGSLFTYNFTIDQPGTYWYHSHNQGQYPDGLRGRLIVHDPENPYLGQYDEEISLSMSDWYHDQMSDLIPSFISVANPTGAEPVPDGALFNDSQNITISVQPGKTYMLRLVNIGAFAAQYFWIEGHEMRIVEVDGVYTEAASAQMIYVAAAQRVSVLVTMKNDTGSNFAFVGSMDQDLFDTVPDTLNPNVTGWLMYSEQADKPVPAILDEFDPFDDFTLVPQDGESFAFMNDVTYVSPKVPTLYSAISSGDLAANSAIYGSSTNSFVLNHLDVVEIVLNNDDPGKHPFHLHGHNFQAVWRSDDDAGFWDPTASNVSFPAKPMRRDTFVVHPNGNIVLRFRADNPGVWLFHCHIEWHVDSGLIATLIEAPLALQETLEIPEDHYQVCRDQGNLTAGNAAGNTVDLLDLKGENLPPAALPDGFTPRGIVALTFSIVSALLGLAAIIWYGAAPLGGSEIDVIRRGIAEADITEK